jgi:hypothetical protein
VTSRATSTSRIRDSAAVAFPIDTFSRSTREANRLSIAPT